MRAQSAPFVAMVEDREQNSAYKLSMALPGGIYPDLSLTLVDYQDTRSTTTDLPEDSRLIVGYPAAEASFTLAGLVDKSDESKTAAWLFGPYSTTSPLYRQDAFRCPVTVDLGLLPDGAGGVAELVRKFTGYVDSYTVNTDGSVDFLCVDLRSDMRGVTSLPSVVTAPPYNAGLTNEFALDTLFRASKGASSWPAQRPNCVVAAGMRASLAPEVGSLLVGVNANDFSFVKGLNGRAVKGSSTGFIWGYRLAGPVTDNPLTTSTVYVEATINVNPTAGEFCEIDLVATNGNGIGLAVGGSSGVVIFTMSVQGNPTNYTVPVTIAAGPHLFEWAATATRLNGVTISNAFVRIDGVTYTIPTYSSGGEDGFPTFNYATTSITLVGGRLEALQVAGYAAPTTSNFGFVPLAVLDPSLNPLQVVPASDGDPFQVIQQIAASELGFAGFDESGIFRFYNRTRLRAGAAVRTITSRTSLASLGIESTAASVVNRAQIGYTPWKFANQATTIYSIATAKKIPARTSLPIIVNLDTAVYNPDTSLVKLPNGSTNTTDSFYRASIDKAGTTEHPGLSFQVVQSNPSKITITVTNATSQDAWLVSPSNYTDLAVGTPVLRLGGFLVTPDTELTADYQYPPIAGGGAAASRFGEVPFTMTGNPWVQDDDAANALAQDIVNQSSQPIPNLTGVNIVPDPRLQLADRVRIQDPDVTGVDEYAQIFSITTSLSANDDGTADYSMSIDARTITKPGAWILGVTGRSELGVTTWI